MSQSRWLYPETLYPPDEKRSGVRECDTLPAPSSPELTTDDDMALRTGACTVLSVLMIGLKHGIGPHYRDRVEWLELAITLEEQARIIRDTCVASENNEEKGK